MTRPVYLIRIQPLRDNVTGIHGLRAILKRLLRSHNFRCLSAVQEIPDSSPDSSPSDIGIDR
jgi:hypothetical protein